jgi:hypothetical protein
MLFPNALMCWNVKGIAALKFENWRLCPIVMSNEKNQYHIIHKVHLLDYLVQCYRCSFLMLWCAGMRKALLLSSLKIDVCAGWMRKYPPSSDVWLCGIYIILECPNHHVCSQKWGECESSCEATILISASVNINASYIEALLCKKLIRSKIYFLCTFFLHPPSYIDVFQQICFSYFLDVLSQTRSTLIVIDKDEINLFYIWIFLCT